MSGSPQEDISNSRTGTGPGLSGDRRDKSESPSSEKSRDSGSGRSGGGGSEKGQSKPSAGVEFFEDPFADFFSSFSDRQNKFGSSNNKKERPPRPRLSERIFKEFRNPTKNSSIFDLEDLKKKLEEEKKMFFDGVDPFGGQFPSHRGGSPGPAGSAGGAGSGSPRMGRTGFPFDNSARSRLADEFGARIPPMFSTMRRPQHWGENDDPFGGMRGTSPFSRERNNSGSSGCASGSSTASAGEHEHIIPIRIERSDGTSTTKAPSASASASASASSNNKQNNPISATPIPMPAPEGMAPLDPAAYNQNNGNGHEKVAKMSSGPQRSSTEVKTSSSPYSDRTSRAQSAPPDSLNTSEGGDRKFVSSVNIETPPQPNVNRESFGGPQFSQLGGKCTKEKSPPATASNNTGDGRQIPIVVEGRGAGRRFTNQQPEPQRNGPIPAYDVPQHEQQQQKSPRPTERESPPPKKQAQPKDPIEKITEITNDVLELEVKIVEFAPKAGAGRDKEYLFLDEMLTRNLIKLDVIETDGREDVRQARKDCIKLIQNCISKLENKVPLLRQGSVGDSIDQGKGQASCSQGQMELDASQPESGGAEQAKQSSPALGSSEAIPLGCGSSSSETAMEMSPTAESTTEAITLSG